MMFHNLPPSGCTSERRRRLAEMRRELDTIGKSHTLRDRIRAANLRTAIRDASDRTQRIKTRSH